MLLNNTLKYLAVHFATSDVVYLKLSEFSQDLALPWK